MSRSQQSQKGQRTVTWLLGHPPNKRGKRLVGRREAPALLGSPLPAIGRGLGTLLALPHAVL